MKPPPAPMHPVMSPAQSPIRIDATKIPVELGWRPQETLESGLAKTAAWYLGNAAWIDSVTSGAYRNWVERNYAARGAA